MSSRRNQTVSESVETQSQLPSEVTVEGIVNDRSISDVDTAVLRLCNVSERIRYLDGKGFTRMEVSKLLGKRYQHVRNVLEESSARGSFYNVNKKLSGTSGDQIAILDLS